uniref:Cysteine proteinase inhibitor n=1 Tax=Davidia involucrata TaxID=16924 RepID=A0A5B7BDT0_DAVIN
MAFRSVIGGIRTSARLHDHLKTSKVIGVFGPIIINNRLLCTTDTFVPPHMRTFPDVSPVFTRNGRPSSRPRGGLYIHKNVHEDEYIIGITKFAVNKHNEKENSNLEFVRVLGACRSTSYGRKYNFVFEAAVGDDEKKFYRAEVRVQEWVKRMELLLLEPLDDPSTILPFKLENW